MFGFNSKTGGIKNSDWEKLRARVGRIDSAYEALEDRPDKLARFALFRLEEFAQGIDLPPGVIDEPVVISEQMKQDFRQCVEYVLKPFYEVDLEFDISRNGYYRALDWCAEKESQLPVYDKLYEVVQNLAVLFLHFYKELPKTTDAKGQPRLFVTVQDEDFGDKRESLSSFYLVLDKIREETMGALFPNAEEYFADREATLELPLKRGLTKYSNIPPHFLSFLDFQGIYSISDKNRFEHMHVLARSGHGKTQLLENFIFNDIMRAHDETLGVCVIDGQADLIKDIKNLKVLSPLQDRVIIVDPSDVEHPFCLNPFDIGNALKGELTPLKKQELYTNAVSLLEFVFSALGTSMTAKQTVLFRNVVELLISIEGSTLMSMKELLEDSAPFVPYYESLDPITKDFFVNQFDEPTYSDTKYQVLTRLYSILKTPALAGMFTAKTNQLDLYEEMNRGAIILVDTDKHLLKEDGHSLLGRYFIALIVQAAYKRKFINEDERTPFFVYVDECHDYIDEKVAVLLDQARKYKVGMTLSHQLYDQTDTRLKSTIKTNTNIKLFGALSAKDRTASAKEIDMPDEFLTGLKSIDRKGAEYALKVGNQKPVKVFTPFGIMREAGQIEPEVLAHILRKNRERYCTDPATENIRPVTPVNEPEIATAGHTEAPGIKKPATPSEETGFSIDDVEDL